MSLRVGADTQFNNSISNAIAATQNDYAPAGIATATVVRVNGGGASRNITGIVAPAPTTGKTLIFVNDGATNNLVLQHQNVGSTGPNRFALPGGVDITIRPNGAVMLRYSLAAARWRVIANAA